MKPFSLHSLKISQVRLISVHVKFPLTCLLLALSLSLLNFDRFPSHLPWIIRRLKNDDKNGPWFQHCRRSRRTTQLASAIHDTRVTLSAGYNRAWRCRIGKSCGTKLIPRPGCTAPTVRPRSCFGSFRRSADVVEIFDIPVGRVGSSNSKVFAGESWRGVSGFDADASRCNEHRATFQSASLRFRFHERRRPPIRLVFVRRKIEPPVPVSRRVVKQLLLCYARCPRFAYVVNLRRKPLENGGQKARNNCLTLLESGIVTDFDEI